MRLILLVIFIFIFSCNMFDKNDYPAKIKDKNLEELFNNAKWEIYKYNIVRGEDYFNGQTDIKGDTILTDFESLDLHFVELFENGDTLTIAFSFNNSNLSVVKRGLETEVSFLHSKIIGLDLFNHIGILYDEPGPIMETEFKEYIQKKEPSDMNTWLLKEAKKRGIKDR